MMGLIYFPKLLGSRMSTLMIGIAGDEVLRMIAYLYATIIISVFVLAILDYDVKGTMILKRIEDESGNWLAGIGFLLTVVGLYISALALRDLRRIISTFEQFASRLHFMIDEVIKSKNDSNFLHILAYTPLPGRLALKEREYRKLRRKLLQEGLRVEVTSLDLESCLKWNKSFIGKKMAGGDRCVTEEVAFEATDEIFLNISRLQPVTTSDEDFKEELKNEHSVRRGPMAYFPKFFAYFTNDRALIANMLFYPFDELPSQPPFVLQNVTQVIGFETTESTIIDKLKDLCEEVRIQIKKWEEEHSSEIEAFEAKYTQEMKTRAREKERRLKWQEGNKSQAALGMEGITPAPNLGPTQRDSENSVH
jgi:hypothetical protein